MTDTCTAKAPQSVCQHAADDLISNVIVHVQPAMSAGFVLARRKHTLRPDTALLAARYWWPDSPLLSMGSGMPAARASSVGTCDDSVEFMRCTSRSLTLSMSNAISISTRNGRYQGTLWLGVRAPPRRLPLSPITWAAQVVSMLMANACQCAPAAAQRTRWRPHRHSA